MLFGPWFGLLYTLIGENISANISFVVGRYLMSDLEGYIHNKNQIFSRIIEHIQGNGFLAVLFMGDVLWAAFASAARPVLARYSSVRNRLTGAFLVAAGVGLALSRR